MTRFETLAACLAALVVLGGTATGDPAFTYGKADELKDVKKVDYKASAQLGAILTSGNSRTTTLALGAMGSRKDKDNKLQLDVTAAYAKSQLLLASDVNGDKVIEPEEITRNSKVTTQSWAVKLRYDRFFTPRNSLFVSALTSADRPAGKKLVGGGQVGYSRLLFKTGVHELAAELGYDFSYESYVDTKVQSVSIHSLRAFTGYTGKLSDVTGVQRLARGAVQPEQGEGRRTEPEPAKRLRHRRVQRHAAQRQDLRDDQAPEERQLQVRLHRQVRPGARAAAALRPALRDRLQAARGSPGHFHRGHPHRELPVMRKPMRIALVMLVALAGTAAAKGRRLELGGFGGGHVFSTTNELGSYDNDPLATAPKNALAFGMRLGVEVLPHLWLEGELAIMPTKTRVCCADVDVTAVRANALYEFAAGRTRAFVLAGYGLMASSSSDESLLAEDIDPAAHVGAGAKFDVFKSWGVRLDGRVLFPPLTKGSGVTTDFEGLLGVYGRFGGPDKPAPAPVVVAPVPDAQAEAAAKLEAEQKQHELEEAEKQKQAEARANADTDADGVRDADDKCPAQAGPVENGGCPDKDTDGDGIVDRLDKCPLEPETVNGYQDDDGCADQLPAALAAVIGPPLGVKFKKAALDPKTNAVLDKVAAALAATPEVRVRITARVLSKKSADKDAKTGKHDATDKDQALAAARAEAVRAYLVSKGIETARLDTNGIAGGPPAGPGAAPVLIEDVSLEISTQARVPVLMPQPCGG